MISQYGYIKLNRKLNKWGWKTDPNMVALWIHLLTNASYDQHEFLGIKIEPGQLVTGRKKLAFETGISERTIRTCLKHLKSTNEVTIKTTAKYSIISIVKWQEYQARDQVSDQQVTSNRPASDQQVTTTKEVKEIKKVKKEVRAARISENWEMSEKDLNFALKKGLSKIQINTQAEKFKNYWIAKSGKDATKLDRNATWNNWIINAVEYAKPKTNGNGKSRVDAALDKMYEERGIER